MSDAAYWTARLRRHGHTGWSDAAVYAYDQHQRLAAVRSLLPTAFAPDAAALDYGCGVGDFCELLLTRCARVVGFDPVPAVLNVARQRQPHVEFTGDVQVALQGPYVVILSITVMQHVADDAELSRLLARLAGALLPGGQMVMLETFAGATASTGGHQTMRPRADFVAACAASGLALRKDLGFYHPTEYPTPAYSAYRRRLLVRVLGRLAGWRVPGATAALQRIARHAAAADDQALECPKSPTRLMLFERVR